MTDDPTKLLAELWSLFGRVDSCQKCGDTTANCCDIHGDEYRDISARVEACLLMAEKMEAAKMLSEDGEVD